MPPGWVAELSWLDVAGVAKAVSEKRNYLDKKVIFVSDSNTTQPLELLLDPVTKDSAVWLCQVQCREVLAEFTASLFMKYTSRGDLSCGSRPHL